MSLGRGLIVLLAGTCAFLALAAPQCNNGICATNSDCSAFDVGKYCKKADGDCNGTGVCTARPVAIDPAVSYVCGCDGNNYQNRDFAASAGTSVAHAGPCSGCLLNEHCAAAEFCYRPVNDCGDVGQCLARPSDCPDPGDRVCGCDETTYASECHAYMAGVSVAYAGVCLLAE